MPYGNQGRLGDRIDPRLMMADYSGFANAGMIKGQALSGLGQTAGDAIKLRGDQNKFISKSEKLAKDIAELIPELEPQATAALQAMNNPDASHRDRLAMAESIKETLQIGMMGIQNQREKEMMALQKAAMAARGKAQQAPGMKIGPMQEYTDRDGVTRQFQVVSFNGQDTLMTPEEAMRMSRNVQGAIGLSDVIKSPEGPWSGVPFEDPSKLNQQALGIPKDQDLGVILPSPKEKWEELPGGRQVNLVTGKIESAGASGENTYKLNLKTRTEAISDARDMFLSGNMMGAKSILTSLGIKNITGLPMNDIEITKFFSSPLGNEESDVAIDPNDPAAAQKALLKLRQGK